MKTRTVLQLVLLICLALAIAIPASADVFLPSGLVEIEAQAFMDSAWLRGSCVIPEGVTTIGARAFYGCSGLTSLTIPETVKHIGSQAFYGCTGLTGTITLSDDVTVADDAFANCPGLTVVSAEDAVDPSTLFKWSVSGGEITITSYIGAKTVTSVTVPETIDGLPVTAIGSNAFSSSRYLTSISLPCTVKELGSHAFSYCSKLQSVTMPSGVTEIGRYAFYYCSNLGGEIRLIDAEIPSNAFTGCKALTVMNFSSNADGSLSLSRIYGSQTSIRVPASFEGRIVTAIGREAFSMRTTLRTVELPQTITSIGQSAFYYCSALEYVYLPDGVASIGASAFYNCTALENVRLPASVTSIDMMAFYGCSSLYETFTFTDASINASAFNSCGDVEVWCYNTRADGSVELASVISSASSLEIPAGVNGRSVTRIVPNAFYDCRSVASISLPATITAIEDETFYGCKTLQTISIPASVTRIGQSAFRACTALQTISIPAAVTIVDAQAFYGCTALTSASIASCGTHLGSYAFANCSSLASVSLPDGFTNVGNMAFASTPWLRSRLAAIAQRITSGCSSDYERALTLHDWLITTTAYDLSYTHYGPEGVIFHGLGVCNAYTLTYSAMLDAVGVNNMTISGTATDKNSGNSGGHAWTLVQLAGEWYHIDTTWDDPIPDGRERRTYFCLTDAQISDDHQWDTASYPAANGTTYSSAVSAVAVMSMDDGSGESTVALSDPGDASTPDESCAEYSVCQDTDDSTGVKDNRNNNKKDKKR